MKRSGKPVIFLFSLLFLLSGFAFAEQGLVFSADYLSKIGELVRLKGKVKILYQKIEITSEELTFNETTGEIQVPGKADFKSPEAKLVGSNLNYNYKTRQGFMEQTYGQLRDLSPAEEKVSGQLFFWAKKLVWSKNKMFLDSVKVTTCERESPQQHYFLKAREIEINPRDKMVARKVELFLGEKKLYGLPTLVTPLSPKSRRQSQQSYIPRIAYQKNEGWQVREKLNYFFGDKSWGALHLDYYGQAGFGKGVEHYLEGEKGMAGIYYYDHDYPKKGIKSYEFSGSVNYRLPGNFLVASSYKYDDQIFPGVGVLKTRSFQTAISRSSPRHSYWLNHSLYKEGDNTTFSYGLTDRLNFSPDLSSRLVFNVGQSSTPSSESRTFHLRESLLKYFNGWEAQLDWEEARGEKLAYGLSRRPELILRFPRLSLAKLPLFLALSYGKFSEAPQGKETSRLFYSLEIPPLFLKTGKDSRFFLSGDYKGFNYKEGEKLSLTSWQSYWHKTFTPFLSARFNYFSQRPKGQSPLLIDSQKEVHLLQGGLQFSNQNHFHFDLFSSYDFLQQENQQLSALFGVNPNNDFSLFLGADYNLPQKRMKGLDSQFAVKLFKDFTIKYWSYYDFDLKELVYQDYSIYKDMHCWALRLTYRKSQQQLWMQVFLKAFPSDESPVGPSPEVPIMPQNYWERFNY